MASYHPSYVTKIARSAATNGTSVGSSPTSLANPADTIAVFAGAGCRRQAAASTRKVIAVTELVSFCIELLSLNPVQCKAENRNNSASATEVWRAAMRGTSAPRYSAAATAPNATTAQLFSQSAHPMAKPAGAPKARFE